MALGLEQHFYYWAFPILSVEFVLLSIAGYAFYHRYYKTSQIMLAILGAYWCFVSLWVEEMVWIWYGQETKGNEAVYNYMDPRENLMMQMKNDKRPGRYLGFCDIASWGMCTPALMSPYNRILSMIGIASDEGMLDWANCSLMAVIYICHILCPITCASGWDSYPDFAFFTLCLTAFAGLVTLYLLYIFVFVLQDVCISCISLTIINFALLPTSYKAYQAAEDDLYGPPKPHMS
mmetsp:Transcript_3028/g.5067  ORF Transcript_3028/g.5067 Transcript_3028/m.5067 type:complete len:234 (-) Transcript_3028:78-779(-)|eukprot:CAMPEP_0169099162 /NCGR_PEP_ID=MMETSP1015-20121227/20417_1 /TAXON_ID=342587 /ORGANISM="Karlodinium micrum, Strain CCMP2283" /LENGTH=233 /DNA_ID=CAMNT_0009160039 /DNA_START=91 /DNA_END=792 /DNA_ORIENTATION=+